MGLKFHFFPAAFPDETLHSVLSRYARLCGVGSCQAAFDGARSAASFSQNVAFPCRLADLVEALPSGTGLSVAEVIKRHTLLPYYAPFITQVQIDHAQALMAGDGKGLMLKLGVNASRLEFASRVRFCSECIDQDQARNGVAYWHRVHTLPGVLVCPHHGTLLRILDDRWLSRTSRQLNLPGDDGVQAHSILLDVPFTCRPVLHEIALRSQQVLEARVTALSAYAVRARLLQGAVDLHLGSSAHRLHLQRLAQHMASFCKMLPPAWEYSILSELRVDTPATWVTKLLRKPRASHHPLKYIVLASALKVDMASVLSVGTPSGQEEVAPRLKTEFPPRRSDQHIPVIGSMDSSSAAVWECALAGADAKRIASVLGVSVVYVYRTIRAAEGGPDLWRKARFAKELRDRRRTFEADYRSQRANDCSGYAWLYRCDRRWLSECIQKRGGVHANRADNAGRFATLDVDLAKQVILCGKALRALPGKPIRVSRTRIGRELHALSRFEKQLGKLPLCASALAKACETLNEFRHRRLQWAEQKLRLEKKPITQSSLYRTASIRLKIAHRL